MNTFTYIANKLFINDIQYNQDINVDNFTNFSPKTYISKIFTDLDSDTAHINFIKTCFIFSNKPKFSVLVTEYFDNYFITEKDKESFITFFSNIQRIYWSFNKFARRIKMNIFKVKVEQDLLLTPILPTQKNIFRLLENNCIYLFTLQDLSRIIITSICNSDSFHSEPIHPKNPYSGVEISISNLYNIYFTMKEKLLVVPNIIHHYFLSNFDIDKFKINNQSNIRNIYINQFVNNENNEDIIEHIYDMIEPYRKINIHNDFPNKVLIDTFKPMLTDYLHYKYSLDNSIRNIHSRKLSLKLKDFIKNTPGFGRKVYTIVNNKKYISFIKVDGYTEKTPYIRPDTRYNIVDSDTSSNDDTSFNMSLFDDSSNIVNNVINNVIQIDPTVRDALFNIIQSPNSSINSISNDINNLNLNNSETSLYVDPSSSVDDVFNNNLSSNIENDSSLSIIIPNPTNVDLFSSTTAMSILYNSHMSNLYDENSIILNDDTNHGYSDNDTIFNDSDDEIIVDESIYDP